MILASHQPNYLPNLGFLYKMAQADLFVIFSNIQFSRQDGWVRRHKIRGVNKDVWLTVPVHAHQNEQKIKDVQIDNSHDWRHKHRATLRHTYMKTTEQEALARIMEIYERPWGRLVDLNVALTLLLKELMGITTPVLLDEEVCGEKQDLLINLCTKYGADMYLSGMGGKLYMTDEYFHVLEQHKIDCRFVEQDLTAQYPYTSLHYLFTEGIEPVSMLCARARSVGSLTPMR